MYISPIVIFYEPSYFLTQELPQIFKPFGADCLVQSVAMYQCTVYTNLMNVITKHLFHASKDTLMCSKAFGILNQYSQLVFNTDLLHTKIQNYRFCQLLQVTNKRMSGCGKEGSWME